MLFCPRYNLRKVNYIALFSDYILKNIKLYIQEHSLEPLILVQRLIYEMGRNYAPISPSKTGLLN